LFEEFLYLLQHKNTALSEQPLREGISLIFYKCALPIDEINRSILLVHLNIFFSLIHKKNIVKINTKLKLMFTNRKKIRDFYFHIAKAVKSTFIFILQRVNYSFSEKPRTCNAHKWTHCHFTRSIKTSRNFFLCGLKLYLFFIIRNFFYYHGIYRSNRTQKFTSAVWDLLLST